MCAFDLYVQSSDCYIVPKIWLSLSSFLTLLSGYFSFHFLFSLRFSVLFSSHYVLLILLVSLVLHLLLCGAIGTHNYFLSLSCICLLQNNRVSIHSSVVFCFRLCRSFMLLLRLPAPSIISLFLYVVPSPFRSTLFNSINKSGKTMVLSYLVKTNNFAVEINSTLYAIVKMRNSHGANFRFAPNDQISSVHTAQHTHTQSI